MRLSQEMAAFNQMCKYDFNLYSFPLLRSYVFFMPFYVFIFLRSTRAFPVAPRYSSIVMRKSNLRSSFVNKAFWLSYFFYPFLQDMFLLNERSFKALDH